MTHKFKIGDKVSIKAEITEIGHKSTILPIRIKTENSPPIWMSPEDLTLCLPDEIPSSETEEPTLSHKYRKPCNGRNLFDGMRISIHFKCEEKND